MHPTATIFFHLFLLSCLDISYSWGVWFQPTPLAQMGRNEGSGEHKRNRVEECGPPSAAEFSISGIEDDMKGVKLVENANHKVEISNTCWQNAYRTLFASCSDIMASEEKRSLLAWHLSVCFQKDSGGSSFPLCPFSSSSSSSSSSSMKVCLSRLDDDARKVYLEFYLETNSICHQLQANAFKRDTERLINSLKTSADRAEERLEEVVVRAKRLQERSAEIKETMGEVKMETQNLSETTKKVEGHMGGVMRRSEEVYEQTKRIGEKQKELEEGQQKMKEVVERGLEGVEEWYAELGRGIIGLKEETVEIEKKVGVVGEAMFQKMDGLRGKAEDLGIMAGVALDKQKELLLGQSSALDALQFISNFQSHALQESRGVLQQITDLGRHQQEEILLHQSQLQQAHNHLVHNSKSILAAQEAFESKQENMFVTLDKLFTIQHALLLESRLIKAFFIYSLSIFVIYMLTSTKQTYTVRPRLYIGLCVMFMIECGMVRIMGSDTTQQARVLSLARNAFVLLSAAQLLHAIYTYMDYERLNHRMLSTLLDKVNYMEESRTKKTLLLEDEEEDEDDDDVNWSLWVDNDLDEEVDTLKDPDYVNHKEFKSSNNLIPKRYELRSIKSRPLQYN